jgi:hypothetical protein
MHELITLVTNKAGITEEQAVKAVAAIKDYVKEKFPMMSGAVDSLFGNQNTLSSSAEKDILD